MRPADHEDRTVTTQLLPADSPAPIRPPGSPWPIPDAAAFLAISDRHLWRLIDGGRVRAIRIGRRVLVPDAEMQRLAREGCH